MSGVPSTAWQQSEGLAETSSLADRVISRDRKAAARLISLIENNMPGVEDELRRLVPHTGHAHIVGITGAAGSGKSSLVWKLISEYRSRGKRVGVVAVDPTSPFTGGAVLGDRVRMQELALDRGVFIRSMASRGALGGLARAAGDATRVLDAYGCDVILVETVGAGQDEVDIARTAHTTVVVMVPGMGDEIQAIKAGILEIADLFVVNKSDRVRADMTVSEIRMMLETGSFPSDWTPPIIKTVATRGEGIAELADAIQRHYLYLEDSGELARRQRETARRELLEAVERRLMELLLKHESGGVDKAALAVAERQIDPRSAANLLVSEFLNDEGDTVHTQGREFPLGSREDDGEVAP